MIAPVGGCRDATGAVERNFVRRRPVRGFGRRERSAVAVCGKLFVRWGLSDIEGVKCQLSLHFESNQQKIRYLLAVGNIGNGSSRSG